MPKRRTVLCALALPLVVPWSSRAADAKESRPEPGSKKPKYYFKIVEVNTGNHGDQSLAKIARELLEKELQSRAEFTSDLGGASDDAAELAELKRRGLKAFRVSLRVDKLNKDLRDPKPGGRRKQLQVDLKLSVFGTTYPGEKLSFSGEGEAAVEAEVIEEKVEQEGLTLTKEVMPPALKQAVDQAVAKLGLPRAAPMNESKRKRKR
jgi:hypothetical protein